MSDLKGSVLKYIAPTEPVAVDDWEVLNVPTPVERDERRADMVASTLPSAETIVVMDDYTLAVPPALAKRLGLRPGQKLQAIFYKGHIEIVPEIDPSEARGSMPGLDTLVDDEDDEE